MATAKLKTYKYYDCHEIMKRFGFRELDDFIDRNHISGNGCLVTLYDPGQYSEEEDSFTKEQLKIHENQKRIYNELGECEIKVWW